MDSRHGLAAKYENFDRGFSRAAFDWVLAKDVGRSYYQSGKVMREATVSSGLPDGSATMFYESGTKMSEANYREVLLDRKSISYYQNGRMKSTAIYKDGYLNGLNVGWSVSGLIIGEANFELGKVVGKTK